MQTPEQRSKDHMSNGLEPAAKKDPVLEMTSTKCARQAASTVKKTAVAPLNKNPLAEISEETTKNLGCDIFTLPDKARQITSCNQSSSSRFCA